MIKIFLPCYSALTPSTFLSLLLLFATILANSPVFGEAAVSAKKLLDPELKSLAERFADTGGGLVLTDDNLPMMRQKVGVAPEPIAEIPVEKRTVPGRNGHPPVDVLVINAKPGTQRAGLIYLHGGGFVLGSAMGSVLPAQKLARDLDITVVSVDYRLAPETTYKGSVEDNYNALLWTRDHAEELGIDPARIGVMGASAGGGHAALLAIAARDRGEVALAYQMLIFPMLDDRTGSTRAVPAHIGTLLWTRQANQFGWKAFLGMEPGGESVPVDAVPARTASLAGLPPTFIVVGTLDLFVLEDIEYGRRLIEAGVPTEMLVLPGAPHGFYSVADASVTRRAELAQRNALRRGLHIKPVR